MKKGVKLWNKAKTLIPGGNQLLSKRSEMFLPGGWPSYYEKARGAEVWDLDGTHYYDFSIMGIGTCVLGYAHPAVNRAVVDAVRKGSMSTLNCREEVELAEKLVALHPWSQMVRFARTGGEACAMAVRIARAASGRDRVMFCGYHGWTDWYLSANISHAKNLDGQLLPGLEPNGVPRSLEKTATPFSYGNFEEFRTRFEDAALPPVGAVIMEVQRSKDIDLDFLKKVRRYTAQKRVPLVYDEVTSGFRLRAGGMHVLHGLEPDLVVLGKAMGNGHPIAAVVGRRSVMDAAQKTFVSSTYWTERVGFAAALAVIREFEKTGAAKKLVSHGRYLREGLGRLLSAHGIQAEVTGLAPVPIVALKEPEPLVVKTLFTQEMLKRGYLASNVIYASTAHTPSLCDGFLRRADEALAIVAKGKKSGSLKRLLEGPVCHSGFQRLA